MIQKGGIRFSDRIMPAQKTSRHGERGVALVSVLWGLAILSLIATLALTASLTARRIESNRWRETHARTLAEATVIRAALALTDPRPAARWRIDGVVQDFVFEGQTIAVTLEDELGKIDLNTGREDLLRKLFQAAVADAKLADTLTDRVLDWRTPGDQKRVNGATLQDYRDAGLSYRPRGDAFQSVEELRLVLGMTPAIFETIAPAVTVYSRKAAIDPAVAPALVRRAVSGTTATSPVSASVGLLDPNLGLGGRAFTLRMAVDLGGKPYVTTAVIRLTGDPTRPYWILAWNGRPVRKDPP